MFLPSLLFSQNKISITVKDANSNVMERAIINITQNNKQIKYGITDAVGELNIEMPSGNYFITVNKLGYEAESINLAIDKSENLSIILKEKITKLTDVIITSRPRIMKIKTDTISYNLKTVVDGTENKIEDVIKKLPGFEVDQAGKVSFKGQEIDNILIDGNEFFNNKHQMATQNIDANMIEGIDLLTNYMGFSGGYAGSSKGTALNLKTKEGYKNKWTGDLQVGKGDNNAFEFHNNLFKFSKKGNVSILLDYNTVAKSPITINDYVDMQNIGSIKNTESSLNSFEIPNFLNPNSYFTERKNSFVGINYTALLNAKVKVTATNLFNNANSIESQFKNQVNLNNTNNTLKFSDYKDSKYLLNNSTFKLEFKKSKKTFISYTLGVTPDSNKEKNNIVSLDSIKSQSNNNNFNFGQQLHMLTTLSQKINYNLNLINKVSSFDKILALYSNRTFFNTNSEQLNQKINQKNILFAFNNTFLMPLENNIYSLKVNLQNSSNTLYSAVDQSTDFNNNLELKTKKIELIPSWKKKWDSKWNSTLAAKLSYKDLHFEGNPNSFFRLEPSVNVNYAFTYSNSLSINYTINHNLPLINQLQHNSTIIDFQSIQGTSLLNYNQISPINEFSIDYQNISSKNQSVLFAKINYNTATNVFSNNTIYEPSSTTIQSIITKGNQLLNVLLLYHLKFTDVPFSLKNTVVYRNTTGESQFNSKASNLATELLATNTKIQSHLKNTWIQFDLGLNFKEYKFEQSINSFSNTTTTLELSVLLKGNIKNKIKWDLGINRNYQNSSYSTNTINFLNANLEYNLTNKIKIKCEGFNLLNLTNSNIIKTNLNDAFFTETTTQIMPGYILVGLNYSY